MIWRFFSYFICLVDPADRQVTDFTNVTHELTILNNISCKCIHEAEVCCMLPGVCVCDLHERFFHLDPQQWLQVSNIPVVRHFTTITCCVSSGCCHMHATHSCYTLHNSVFWTRAAILLWTYLKKMSIKRELSSRHRQHKCETDQREYNLILHLILENTCTMSGQRVRATRDWGSKYL